MRSQIEDAMSSFDINAIVREISPVLLGHSVDNVYQIDPRTILITFRGIRERLVLESGRRIHLTSYRDDIPLRPTVFCQIIRKAIARARLIELTQHDFERIVKLTFCTSFEQHGFYAEFFGSGNFVLVDKNDRIIHPLFHRTMRDRDIARGEIYVLPPTDRKNVLEANLSDLERLQETTGSLTKQLTRLFNVGSLYAEEIMLRAGLDQKATCESLSIGELQRLLESTRSIVSEMGRTSPMIVVDEQGGYLDLVPFRLKTYERFAFKAFAGFSEAADEYYRAANEGHRKLEKAAVADDQLGEQRRILEAQKAQVLDLQKSSEANQKNGDAIFANLNLLQQALDYLMSSKRSGKSWETIMEEADSPLKQRILSIDSESAMINIRLDSGALQLDIRKSIYENAELYYDLAKRSRSKLVGLTRAMEETEKRIARIRLKEQGEPHDDVPREIRRRDWYERFHWFTSSDGYLVLGGRDATTNDILVRRHVGDEDIVLHTEAPGSPFCVIKVGIAFPPQNTISEAAQMVASYSRAWRSNQSSADVYWVEAGQVNKSPPSGTHLQKGSFMVHGMRNYIRGVPLKIAIGLKEDQDELRVVGGPVSAISAQTKIYVEIVPGREKAGRLISQIVTVLSRKAPQNLQARMRKIPSEEFQAFIPGGGGEIAIKQ